MKRWQILAIFVLSGAAGLVYEVVWARQLVLVFGNTTQAVSAILTGFFGGMALGSAVGGRLGDRVRRPLRMYAILEILLVAVVLITPVTFRLLHEVYRGIFASLEAQPAMLGLVRFGLSLLALGPATVMMGATLPVLTRYLSRDPSQLSQAFGRLYAANTIGAILGTAVAGFLLIELLGLTGTLIFGAVCSGLAGILALLIDWRHGGAVHVSSAEPMIASDVSRSERPRMQLALIVAFASGLTSLAYQVLWTRLLATGTGNSTYVFTTILMVFLTGLALGAVVFSWIRPRIKDTVSLLAFGQMAVALIAILGLAFVIKRPGADILHLTTSFRTLFTNLLLPVTLVVLPATFLMGLTFPAASALVAGREGHVATNSGLLLALNTLGAIAGTFVIPFFVIPKLGSPTALGLIALANVLIGLWLAIDTMRRNPRSGVMQAIAGGALLVLILWSFSAGRIFVDPNVKWVKNHGQMYKSREDEIASVQAGQIGKGEKELWVTGCSMTLLTVDAKLMPVLPLILRPESKTACTIAFGMGSAYRAALNLGLKTDAVELVPSVPTMFGYFYPDADRVLSDPNGHLIIADGRNHIELTNKTYDIIIVDPPPPIESAGVSVISSHEFYQAAKRRLTPGGVMMQWMPYGQTVDEFKAQIRTYRDVFPNLIIGIGPGNYGFYLLGSEMPMTFDPALTQQILSRPGVIEDLSSAFDSPEHTYEGWVTRIPNLIWLQNNEVDALVGKGPMVTDDKPMPEYFFLRHMVQNRFGKPSPNVSPALLPELKAAALSAAGATN